MDGVLIRPQPRVSRNGTLHVLYSGNLGLAHDVETICRVMEALKDDRRFQFTFAGGGARRDEVEEFCRGKRLRRVSFQPYCPRERLGDALGTADIGLVTQLPASLGSLVPSVPRRPLRPESLCAMVAAGTQTAGIGPASWRF
jgi:hypothetical protein